MDTCILGAVQCHSWMHGLAPCPIINTQTRAFMCRGIGSRLAWTKQGWRSFGTTLSAATLFLREQPCLKLSPQLLPIYLIPLRGLAQSSPMWHCWPPYSFFPNPGNLSPFPVKNLSQLCRKRDKILHNVDANCEIWPSQSNM